ncbi:prostatic spermine-binding protein-like [Impatiens glandulifera]|uniref:prostatic spermine-binding protein-like n=1 Tax=Impatiens glandulifera TaxID=253017 RepID=UPI001FB12D74|nr:prostatic spermine-binding protein-like [Impatiens glandulifera]
MEVGGFYADLASMERTMVFSVVEALAMEVLLAAQRCCFAYLLVQKKTGSLTSLNDESPRFTGIDKRFPLDQLKRKEQPELENKDASDSENDDGEDDDDEQDAAADDDDEDEDFSGGEEDDDDDEEGNPEEDAKANGKGGSDDDEDEDDDEGDEDDEGDDDDEEEDEDEEDEEDQPAAKKRK